MTVGVAEFVPKPCEPSARSSSDIEYKSRLGGLERVREDIREAMGMSGHRLQAG